MVKSKKDSRLRKLVLLNESRRRVLKAISVNRRINISVRWWAQVKLSALPRLGSISKLNNYCVQTGRSRSTINFYKLSRLRLRKLASTGSLPGLKKACW